MHNNIYTLGQFQRKCCSEYMYEMLYISVAYEYRILSKKIKAVEYFGVDLP